MKICKLYLVIVILMLSNSFTKANNEQPRGIDLGEYAFGIPVDQLNFNNKSPFTFSFWLNIKEFNHSEQGTQFINVRHPDGNWVTCDWGHLWSTIGNSLNDEEATDGTIAFVFRDPTQSNVFPFTIIEDVEFSEGEWVYVSFIYKYTDTPDMALYINGELVAELNKDSSFYPNLRPMPWSNDYIIMIGGPAFQRSPLNAYIDKVQFYNKALSQANIIKSMSRPLSRDTSLLGYWNFEDGCTTDAEGFMQADKGSVKAAMYKILTDGIMSIGTEIKPFTFGEGVDPESVIQGVEENNITISKTKIFVSNEMLNIENTESINSVVVYDATGKVITSVNANGATSTQIALPLTIKGVIMVKVNNEVVKVICD